MIRDGFKSQSPQIGALSPSNADTPWTPPGSTSQSPQIGALSPSADSYLSGASTVDVSIPSNRGSVSVAEATGATYDHHGCLNPLKSGLCLRH